MVLLSSSLLIILLLLLPLSIRLPENVTAKEHIEDFLWIDILFEVLTTEVATGTTT